MSEKGFTERIAARYCEWFREYRDRYDRMNNISTSASLYYGTLFWANVPIYLGVQKWRKSKLNYLDK